MRKTNVKQNKKGQILLIAVMLLATVITVVMTVAFNSTNETKIAKLEEDSQKALAAAEAGVEAVIKQSINSSPVSINSLGQFNSQGITGNAQVTSISKPTFVTPLLQKDEQYTFYLSNYPDFTPQGIDSLDIYFYSESGQCPSIEVSVITTSNSFERYAYNTCGGTTIANAMTETPIQTTIQETVFEASTPTLAVSTGKVAFIKVLKGRTKIGFQGYKDGFTFSLPAQGKLIESEARTQSGVVKKVQLFQSYPQIPSNFFMTSF